MKLSKKDIEFLSITIAADIFNTGVGPKGLPHRIQFMGGSYPDHEIGMGGLVEGSLANVIKNSLTKAITTARN